MFFPVERWYLLPRFSEESNETRDIKLLWKLKRVSGEVKNRMTSGVGQPCKVEISLEMPTRSPGVNSVRAPWKLCRLSRGV